MRGVDQFNPHDKSVASKWEYWKVSLHHYIVAENIQGVMRKRATLLHMAGPELQRIVEGLPDPGETYQDTIAALDEYFRPRINPIFEIHQFMQVKQREDETIDAFVSRLRSAAKNCDFGALLDKMLVTMIASGCKCDKLRCRLLGEADLNLARALDLARNWETGRAMARAYQTPTTVSSFLAFHQTTTNHYIHQPTYHQLLWSSTIFSCLCRCSIFTYHHRWIAMAIAVAMWLLIVINITSIHQLILLLYHLSLFLPMLIIIADVPMSCFCWIFI